MSENEQITESGLENTETNTSIENGAETFGEETVNDNSETSDGQENNSAPDVYDFKDLTLPEGFQIDEKLAAKFTPVGKELNLTQQQANKLAELLVDFQKEQMADMPEKLAEYKKQESEATKLRYEKLLNEDEEIGKGDKAKMDEYLDMADIGYSNFASPQLKGVFKELHLDYHPEVIKLFHKLGKLCGNDNITKAKAPVGVQQSAADILYGDSEG